MSNKEQVMQGLVAEIKAAMEYRKAQESVINKLCTHLKPNGYFFLGHSESITGINVPLKQIKPTVFRKADTL